MAYILRLLDRKRRGMSLYVAPSGSSSSYTTNPVRAQQFSTRDAARAAACGNEVAEDRQGAIDTLACREDL